MRTREGATHTPAWDVRHLPRGRFPGKGIVRGHVFLVTTAGCRGTARMLGRCDTEVEGSAILARPAHGASGSPSRPRSSGSGNAHGFPARSRGGVAFRSAS